MQGQTDPLVGTLVSGRYRVLKALGEGGMGQVFLAEHEAIEKKVALKVLKREYSEKPDIVTRFQQEAISASRIKHPNVLDVFDFGQLDNGCFFLAMEFLEGHDLAEELQQKHTLAPDAGVRVALQICRALAAAHARGVVHRDMKPENVFLQRTGDGEEIVKIVDFGIAQLRTNEEAAASEPRRRRLTKTGMIFGTPEYMAPEQAAGKKADLRVDLYATGVILYEMFSGAVPHTGDTFMAVLAAHLNDPVPPMRAVMPDLAISAELEQIIYRLLAKKPDDRFASMNELSAAILATPEGMNYGPATRMGSLPDVTASRFPSPSQLPPAPAGNPTNAQFPGTSSTQAQFGDARAPMATSPTIALETGLTAAPAVTTAPEGRTSTQLGAETSAPIQPAPKSKSGALVAVALVAVAGLGAAAFAMKGRGPTPTAEPAAPAPPTAVTAVQAATGAQPSVAPVPQPAPQPAPAGKYKIEISTDPPGATLSKNGFQVCDSTPCDLLANPDEGFELTAVSGKTKGSAKVLAQKDGQKVSIKLAAAPVGGGGPAPGGGGGKKLCEVEVDGLKILRPCP